MDDYLWTLSIVNNARASNAIREVRCAIGSTVVSFITDPDGLLKGEIPAYSSRQGLLKVPKDKMREGFQTIEIAIQPVRGRLCRFRFPEQDLLSNF